MAAKQKAIDIIASMPESINYDEIIQTLDILRRNEKAMEDIRDSRVYTTDEAMKLVRERARYYKPI